MVREVRLFPTICFEPGRVEAAVCVAIMAFIAKNENVGVSTFT